MPRRRINLLKTRLVLPAHLRVWQAYLEERPALKALMVHLRAQGHRACIARPDRLGFTGVRLEDGSLCLTHFRLGKPRPALTHRNKPRRRTKPTWPLFTMWQEKRLVLLKKPKRGLRDLSSKR